MQNRRTLLKRLSAEFAVFPDVCERPLHLHVQRLAYPAKRRLQLSGVIVITLIYSDYSRYAFEYNHHK